MTPIRKALVWAAGADPALMALPGCEPEHLKYSVFGALAIFVAIAATASAFLSGLLFMPALGAAAFAVFWGDFVLTLERAILGGISNGRGANNFKNMALLAVRFAFAGAVGVAITTGFTLVFNATAIDRFEVQQNLTEQNVAAFRIDSLLGGDLADVRTQQRHLDAEIAAKETEAKDAFQIMHEEGEGTRSPHAGAGRLWLADSGEVAVLHSQLAALRHVADSTGPILQSRANTIVARRDRMLAEVRGAQRAGPADRLRALLRLEESDGTMRFISILTLLCLLAFDLTPALTKYLSKERDGYEALLQRLRAEKIAKEDAAADVAVHFAAAEAKRRKAEIDVVTSAAVSDFAQAVNANHTTGAAAAPGHQSAAEVIQAILKADAACFTNPFPGTSPN